MTAIVRTEAKTDKYNVIRNLAICRLQKSGCNIEEVHD